MDHPTTDSADAPGENARELVEVIYTPESELRFPGRVLAQGVRGFWQSRELAGRIFQRNLRGMYRQTLLGFVWAFLPPLANTLIWVFLHSQRVISFDDQITTAYPIYVLTGMVIWQSFVEALQMPLSVVRQNRGMITKLNFHRESLLLVGWGEIALNLAVRLVILIPLLWYYQVALGPALWFFPLGLLLLVLLGTAIGLWLFPIGALYQDVERMLMFGLPLWMILTPIIYPVTAGPAAWLHWFNPVAGILMSTRDSLLLGAASAMPMAWVYGLAAIPLLLAGLIIFRLSLPVLIERMPA